MLAFPKDSIIEYETALKAGHFLAIVHGTVDEAAKADSIIETTNPLQCSLHPGAAVAVAAS